MGSLATLERRSVAVVDGPARDETPRRDAVLLERMRAGDDGALAAVYDRHADVVFGVARRVSGDAQIAREVTQEVFAHLWQHADRVDLSRGSIRTYLAVVAHRRAVDEVRRLVRRQRAESRAADGRSGLEDGHEAGVVDAASSAWLGERLAASIARLPDDQRVALRLAYFQGCTYREVARRLAIPEGTAKSRLRLALAQLRTSLAGDREAAT